MKFYEREVKMELKREVFKKLVDGIKAVIQLIEESKGVSGLHLNGDLATWDSLREGGKYEEWLNDFDEAVNTVEQIENDHIIPTTERELLFKCALTNLCKAHGATVEIGMTNEPYGLASGKVTVVMPTEVENGNVTKEFAQFDITGEIR